VKAILGVNCQRRCEKFALVLGGGIDFKQMKAGKRENDH